ncbi:MAG: glycosyltransferase family 4 protein [Clostridia bacterium]|nr:glycosyltransferase family 4 protein [Clostridia bacterium]
MKKVLIIANQFPPMGGSGVQRSVKFVKNLRAFDYEPVVLTREEENMPLKDETLLKDIPVGAQVYRTKAYELPELQGRLRIPGKILGKFIIPDTAYFWYKKTRKEALRIIKDGQINLIYTTSAPYSDHLLGLYIKKKRPDIKWVADFRDEWTNNPYTLDNPYNPIRTRIEKNMEHKVVASADMLITNTPVMRENFIRNNNISGDNFVVIPNGYDKADFEGFDSSVKPHNDRFTMVYTGALYGRRKPDTFFKALKELKSEGKIDGNKFMVKLIGNYHKDKLQAQIDSFGLTDSFEIVGYVPHNVCIEHQVGADVLVLIEGSGRGANAFYTGKIFEYMNTNRPVLAVLPEGCAADLVKESKIGIVANTDDISQIKANIKEYYDRWCNGTLDFEPDRGVIEGFERKRLTEKLAQVFDKIYEN